MNKTEDIVDDLEMDDDPAGQSDLALMFSLNERERILKRRRKVVISILFLGVIVLCGSGLFYFRDYFPGFSEAGNNGNQPSSETDLKVKSEQVTGNFVLKQIEFKGFEGNPLLVDLYDFDANRFIKGKDQITNQPLFETLLDEKKGSLKDSIIIIFTGASFEGKPDDNRELARRRACYVGSLLTQKLQIDPNLIRMIIAGEFKSAEFNGIADEEAKEEKFKNERDSELQLSAQRRLILITLPLSKIDAAKQNSQEEVLQSLIKSFRQNNLLPTSYDHGLQSQPTLMNKMDCSR